MRRKLWLLCAFCRWVLIKFKKKKGARVLPIKMFMFYIAQTRPAHAIATHKFWSVFNCGWRKFVLGDCCNLYAKHQWNLFAKHFEVSFIDIICPASILFICICLKQSIKIYFGVNSCAWYFTKCKHMSQTHWIFFFFFHFNLINITQLVKHA